MELGLKPHLLSESLLDSLLNIAIRYSGRIEQSLFLPRVNWRNAHNERRQAPSGQVAPALVSAGGNGHKGN